MKYTQISPRYVFLLSCIMFGSSHVVMADEQNVSSDEVSVNQNEQMSYVCFDKSMSNISRVVAEISALDTNLDSPIHLLKAHLENGYLLGIRDEVVNVLEYADWFVGQYKDEDIKRSMASRLNQVIEQVMNGDLDVSEETIMRSPHLRLLTVEERMTVQGKARFKSNVIMEKKLRVHGRARFYDDVTFKDDVTVEDDLVVEGSLSVQEDLVVDGTLSVQDEVVGCDLTVGCNINMNNSTSAAIGNINKAGNRFVHNFGTENTFVGFGAGNFTMTGTDNTGFGFAALESNGAGSSNTAVGSSALALNIAGDENTAVGRNALQTNTADNNTAVGYQALAVNTIGLANTAVGHNALLANTVGTENVAVGQDALLANTLGNSNTALGSAALADNTVGNENVAVGLSALEDNTSAIQNVAVGTLALQRNLTGGGNVAVGYAAGSNAGLTAGAANVFLGNLAGAALLGGSNNIVIGSSAGVAGPESDTIRIGNGLHTRTFISGIRGVVTGVADAIPVLIDSLGQLGTTSSSKRFKHDIEEMRHESGRIYDLNPVKFVYNEDKSEKKQYGLIAEEVAEVFPELVINEQDGTPFTVRYEVLPVLLLNEMQKLSNKVDSMDEALEVLRDQVSEIVSRR